jgi:hypothetical protein
MSGVEPAPAGEPPFAAAWFEEFHVGQSLRADARGDSLGLLGELGIATDASAVRELRWRWLVPVSPADASHVEGLVTRCRRDVTGLAGTVNLDLRLVDRQARIAQEATASMLVKARDSPAPGGDGCAAADFCSGDWAGLLASALGESAAFLQATRTFDGAIGLRAGDESIQLRVFRGRVLEAGRSTPLGATFTLAGSERTWTELALAERNEFIAVATRGGFSLSGNAYEYLRLTKALVAIFDEVRTLAAARAAVA